MGLYSNYPTYTYVGANGISVNWNKEFYPIQSFNTPKKYIYWNVDTPYSLQASNEMPSRTEKQFLVIVNDKGTAVEVPSNSDNFSISYDGNSVESIRDRIFGLYEKNEENGDRFIAIEQNIDGITATVGKVESELGDSKIAESFNSSIIKHTANLGTFKSEFDVFSKDSEITSDERIEINAHIDVIIGSLGVLNTNVDSIIKVATENELDNSVVALNKTKELLKIDHDNLISTVRNVISDSAITPSDLTLVINMFSKYNLRINSMNSLCGEVIALGLGGTIREQLANIGIKSDEIKLSVSNVEKTANGLIESVSTIDQKADSINLKVEKKVDSKSIISAINMSPEQITISSSKVNISGLVSFSDLSTAGKTTIVGDNVTSGTMTGVTIISQAEGARAIMTADGIRFHSPTIQSGKISYDSNGSGASSEARNRLLIESLNGYAMKIKSSGDMSISVGSDKRIYMDSTRIVGQLTSDRVESTHLEVNYGDGLYCDYSGNFHVAKGRFGDRSAFKVNGITGDSMCNGTFYTVNLVYMEKSNSPMTRMVSNKPSSFDVLESFNTDMVNNNLVLSPIYQDEVQQFLNPCLTQTDDGEVGVSHSSVIANLVDCIKELKSEVETLKKNVISN